ncbi:MAG TPA: HupE/UreJ family protein [Burkholderiales bacterium]|jgi:urease accessory protein|nr:HupE/UreJ family protein [Burkholderiales bacterium]
MRRCLRPLAARAGAAAGLLLCATQAHAHSAAKGIGDFYAGALHPLTSLEHVLPFLAFGILAGQQGQKAEPALVAFTFSLSLLAGATLSLWIPGSPWVSVANLASSVVFGALVALARPLPGPLFFAIAVGFGLTHGFANGEGMAEGGRPYLFFPGVALAGLVVTAYGLITTDWLQRKDVGWVRIALRVAGSWIAAIGILVLAVSGRTLFTT